MRVLMPVKVLPKDPSTYTLYRGRANKLFQPPLV